MPQAVVARIILRRLGYVSGSDHMRFVVDKQHRERILS
jgi:hypothetical protein